MSTDGKRPVIAVREVGPRDGLQMVKAVMPTASKLAWIDAMAAAGVSGMEVASFVPPSLMPQMADAAEVTRAARQHHPGLTVAALAPNLRGAQNAASAGVQVVVVPVSASEAHSRANVRRSREDQVAEVARIVAAFGPSGPRIEAGISTAFGCSLQGAVPEDDVVRLAAALAEAGADTVSLADTLGYAVPAQVKRLVRRLRGEIGAVRFGHLHLHDTLGTALANAYAGLEEGVCGFDGALGGLGGCPFAPGSVGNAATEDLVYLLESEGFDTRIDLPGLLAARTRLAELLPAERLHGRVAAAGIPRTYRHAAPALEAAQ
ncbi:Hydroxymethylglutaryl-CoA lyase YngG [Methylobacterium crusticola]|uniref:Hydroxymethylglutaryl-CoA lyase YngG n=1 Tax=Methylobacterium crusticola TaxID=1697972 RepID=A0ABQ4RA80_9HYPH|nr:hydroxymethylglutaryl-CoA lyase [Methylobacterium crusticola]GJD54009.1 Hydroxymethylglutaryl-CoA lyase YngG [Methylobacterium crusticola]